MWAWSETSFILGLFHEKIRLVLHHCELAVVCSQKKLDKKRPQKMRWLFDLFNES